MDGGMTDQRILSDFEAMSKADMIEFADARDIKVDKRWTQAKMAQAIADAIAADMKAHKKHAASEAAADDDGDAIAAEIEDATVQPNPDQPAGAKGKSVTPSVRRRQIDGEIADVVEAWVKSVCDRLVSFSTEAVGDVLLIKTVTVHGENEISAKIDNWTAAGVSKALLSASV